jgi:hypothetical protein
MLMYFFLLPETVFDLKGDVQLKMQTWRKPHLQLQKVKFHFG